MTPRLRSTIQVAPSLLVWAIFFLAPISYFFVASFWRIRHYMLVVDATLDNYRLATTDYLQSIVFTLLIAATIAVITTNFAFAIAYLIRFRGGKLGTLLLFVTLTTLFGGYLVKIYAWKSLLGTEGIVNEALMGSGLIAEPITWLLYSPIAVVLTLVHFMLPFAILPIHGSLRGVADAPIEAARDLGARPTRILVDIILPQCETGVTTAFALAFFVSAGDYVTPQLVGGPNTFMVGNFIQSQFVNRMNTPVGSALAFSTLLATLVVFVVARVAFRSVLRVRA